MDKINGKKVGAGKMFGQKKTQQKNGKVFGQRKKKSNKNR
jgi:hypothetical protein